MVGAQPPHILTLGQDDDELAVKFTDQSSKIFGIIGLIYKFLHFSTSVLTSYDPNCVLFIA